MGTEGKSKIVIDLKHLEELVQKADEIFLTPKGEENLLKILEMQEVIEDARHRAEAILEAKAKSIDPNFSAIQGDKVRVSYQSFGTRYVVDVSNLDKLPERLYTTTTKYGVVTKEVDRFYKEHGNLPVGIIEKDRDKKIYFKPIVKKEAEND